DDLAQLERTAQVARDRLEPLGLLAPPPHLGEQTRVVDRDRGELPDGEQEVRVGRVERARLPPLRRQVPDQAALARQRRREQRAGVAGGASQDEVALAQVLQLHPAERRRAGTLASVEHRPRLARPVHHRHRKRVRRQHAHHVLVERRVERGRHQRRRQRARQVEQNVIPFCHARIEVERRGHGRPATVHGSVTERATPPAVPLCLKRARVHPAAADAPAQTRGVRSGFVGLYRQRGRPASSGFSPPCRPGGWCVLRIRCLRINFWTKSPPRRAPLSLPAPPGAISAFPKEAMSGDSYRSTSAIAVHSGRRLRVRLPPQARAWLLTAAAAAVVVFVLEPLRGLPRLGFAHLVMLVAPALAAAACFIAGRVLPPQRRAGWRWFAAAAAVATLGQLLAAAAEIALGAPASYASAG